MQRFLFLLVILFLPSFVFGQKPVKAHQPPRAKGPAGDHARTEDRRGDEAGGGGTCV